MPAVVPATQSTLLVQVQVALFAAEPSEIPQVGIVRHRFWDA